MIGFGVAVGLADRRLDADAVARAADAGGRRRGRHGLGGVPRPACSRAPRTTRSAAGCRASSSWSSPAARGSPTSLHGAAAASVGTAAAAAGGGVLVVVGTVVAALAVPSFVRYRVTRTASGPERGEDVGSAAPAPSDPPVTATDDRTPSSIVPVIDPDDLATDAARARPAPRRCPTTTPTSARSSAPRRTCTRRSSASRSSQARRRARPRPGGHRGDRDRLARCASTTRPRASRWSPAPQGAFAGELVNPRGCYICKTDYTLVDAFYHWLCPTCAAKSHAKRDQRTDLTRQARAAHRRARQDRHVHRAAAAARRRAHHHHHPVPQRRGAPLRRDGGHRRLDPPAQGRRHRPARPHPGRRPGRRRRRGRAARHADQQRLPDRAPLPRRLLASWSRWSRAPLPDRRRRCRRWSPSTGSPTPTPRSITGALPRARRWPTTTRPVRRPPRWPRPPPPTSPRWR